MAKAGRKKKQGARTPSGRLKRAPAYDYGCAGVVRRREMYGARIVTGEGDSRKVVVDASQTFDALGRAWSAGLLGRRADELRDGGRIIAAQYWRAYGFITPDSLARFQPSAPVGVVDDAREKIREDALADTLATLRARGRDVARAFEQLVIDWNIDAGPAWLDRLIIAKRSGRAPGEQDQAMLNLAIEGLNQVA